MADLPVAGKCMICSKEIRYDGYDEDDNTYYNLNGGSHVRIHAGYGSKLDTLEFRTVVCDECLKDCMHSERITGIREYMGDLLGNTKKEEDKVFKTPEEHFQETMSLLRRHVSSRAETERSSSSPTECPSVSLTRLKLSRSRNSSARSRP